jgi:hypothetical protein
MPLSIARWSRGAKPWLRSLRLSHIRGRKSAKVKRWLLFFADRLVKGGRLDHAYQVTVPEGLDGVR